MWIAVAALLVAASVGTHGQTVINTNGAGGPSCPPGVCSTRAICVGGECECTGRYTWGDGRLCCHKQNAVGAKIYNDPTVNTFNNEETPFPFPCRHLVTDVKTELKINKQVVGVCRCQVHSWNHRWLGKFYVAGYDFSCFINRPLGNSFGFSVRKAGTADNGQYKYLEWGSTTYTPNGPWSSTPVNINSNGVQVRCEPDNNDNVVRVHVRECGIETYLRAYDTTLRRQQPQRPGLVIGVNCAHHPEFLQNDKVTALAPVGFGGQYLADIVYGSLNIEGSMWLRAALQSAAQTQPNAPPTCDPLLSTIHYCTQTNRETALQKCLWMLKRPKFINCINGPPNDNSDPEDANADLILQVFHACVQSVCDLRDCRDSVELIENAGCTSVVNTPELAPYLAACPPLMVAAPPP